MPHYDKIKDCDAFFEVDPISRQIKDLTPAKIVLMQGDHNSERFTFSLPRYIDGYDIAESAKTKVHFMNILNPEVFGMYEAKDLHVDEENEEKVICSWNISGNVTKKPGAISFLIEFECYEGNELVYSWHTVPFSGISIGETFDFAEEIATQYADILEQWEQRLFGELDKIKKDIENLDIDVTKDWNQNDKTAPDYIENRPFYTEYVQETRQMFHLKYNAEHTDKESYWQGIPWGIVVGNLYSVRIKLEKELKTVAIYEFEVNATSFNGNPVIDSDDAVWDGGAIYIEEHPSLGATNLYDFSLSDDVKYEYATISVEGVFDVPKHKKISPVYIRDLSEINFGQTFLDSLVTKKANTAEIIKFKNSFDANFVSPLKKGMQLYYDYEVNGQRYSGTSAPIVVDAEGNLTATIGNKYLTEYAMNGTYDCSDDNSFLCMSFDFIQNVNCELNVNEISVLEQIPCKFLELGKGINIGYESVITGESRNSNNFGAQNYIDGNHNNVHGTGHIVQATNCAVYGQDAVVTGNLVFFGGDRGDISARCALAWGTDIFMSGGNSGAIGYGLRSTGQNQFVIGQFNEENDGAYFIVGSGTADDKRKNAFVVTKDGKIFCNGKILWTEDDRTKLNAFTAQGYENANTGKATVQFGIKNNNIHEHVVQMGFKNDSALSGGGYIYQIGYVNVSKAGQTYLFGKQLIGSEYEQVVVGRNNKETSGIFVVGNGKSTTDRSNAMVITKDNNVHLSGGVVMTSPNGTKYKLTVADDGTLTTTKM